MQGNVNEEKFTQAFNRLVVALAVLDLTEDGVKQTLKNVKEYIELGEFPDIIYTDYSNSRALRIISELGELDKNKEKLTLNEIMSYVYYYTNCISVLKMCIRDRFDSIFGSYSKRELKRVEPIAQKVFALEDEYRKLSDEELQNKTKEFKQLISCLLYTSRCV